MNNQKVGLSSRMCVRSACCGAGTRLVTSWGLFGPDPRKVDTSGVNYATLASIAEVSASKTSGATRLHQEWRLRVL